MTKDELTNSVQEQLAPILDKVTDLVIRENEDEIMGAIYRLALVLEKDESNGLAATELALITLAIGELEKDGKDGK